jgi:aminoglycoside phosphotransferase (APT) family kinase protein
VCDDPAVLGAPFFAMERARGVVLRRDPPAGLALEPELARAIGESFVATFATLHGLPIEGLGLGRPEGYAERQVHGWIGRWEQAAREPTPVARCAAADRVALYLADRATTFPAAAPGVVHNDFKLDNLVLDADDPRRVHSVLDWEMATAGDPLLDLGTTLGYWAEAGDPPALLAFRSGPTHLPGMPTRRELAAAWAAATGRSTASLAEATIFGLFKILVIAQQIYVRYAKGLTRDPRFASLPVVVAALAERAERTSASGIV